MATYIINTVEDLKSTVKLLCKEPRLSADTETFHEEVGGLHPFHGSRAFSVIFANKTDSFYFNFNTGGIPRKHIKDLQPIFDDPTRIIFFVNAMFDACILHFDGIKIHSRIIDCPSIARIEFNRHDGGSYSKDESFLSLAYLANYYGVQMKNDKVKEYINEHNLFNEERCRFTGRKIPQYQNVPLELMGPYGGDDARSTFDIGTKILQCINFKDQSYNHETKMINAARNESALTTVLIDVKIQGCKLDAPYVETAIKHEKELSLRLHKDIDKLTGGINLNSGKQVAEYLVNQGIEIPRKDPTETAIKRAQAWEEKLPLIKSEKQKKEIRKKIDDYRLGNHITDKKTLQKLMKKYPQLDFLAKITHAKEADKKLSTYYGNFMKLKDADDIIHCGLNQEKCVTGRFSSSEPNFQNLHKEKWDGSKDQFMIRKSIIPKHEDFKLFFFDYKGQEMYIMIDLAEDAPVIKDILENGTDIYIAMGNIVKETTGIEIDRSQAKALSLGVAYGQGKALIAKNLGCSMNEAMELKNAFLNGLKGVNNLNKRTMRAAQSTGKIHNPYGRVSYIESGFEYKALNSLIQGTAADCTKKAMVDVHKFLEGKKSHIILTVHDEIIFEIHKDEEHLVPGIAEIMGNAYPHKHLPLRVDIEKSFNSWGEKEEFIN